MKEIINIGILKKKGCKLNIEKMISKITKKRFLEMIKNLTKIHTIEFNNKKTIKKILLYEITKDKKTIILPRHFGNFLLNIFIDKIEIKISEGNNLDKILLSPDFKLSKNQELVIENLFSKSGPFFPENVKKGIGGCICEMKTGEGKTYLACALIAKIKKRTIFICPNSMLIEQTLEVLKMILDNCIITQLSSYASKEELDLVEKCDILVTTHLSLLNQTDEWFEKMNFGFTIFDEIHLYPTPVFHKVFNINCTMYTLGLSATTTQRKDAFDDVYIQYIGPIIVSEKLKDYDISDHIFQYEINAIKYYGPEEFTKTIKRGDQLLQHKMMEQLINDRFRNRMICKIIEDLLKEGRNILILAETRNIVSNFSVIIRRYLLTKFSKEQVDELYKDIVSNNLDISDEKKIEIQKEKDELKISKLMGGKKKSESDSLDVAKNARIICSTYHYVNVGLSIIKLDTLVFLTPRISNMVQILGRISRKGSDQKIIRKVIDIIDMKLYFKHQFMGKYDKITKEKYGRINEYEKKNAKIIYKIVKFSDLEKEIYDEDVNLLNNVN